jgi:predicted protein tyrosine phosphatase
MNTRIYWLHQYKNLSRLGIMAKPRGGEWLSKEILNFKRNKIDVIVSLLEQSEIIELGLEGESQLCLENGIIFFNFPIADRGVPDSNIKLRELLHQLTELIHNGKSIIIHCRMGIGRSSIIAGCLLLKEAYSKKDIFNHISGVRGIKVPDTNEQIKWLMKQ